MVEPERLEAARHERASWKKFQVQERASAKALTGNKFGKKKNTIVAGGTKWEAITAPKKSAGASSYRIRSRFLWDFWASGHGDREWGKDWGRVYGAVSTIYVFWGQVQDVSTGLGALYSSCVVRCIKQLIHEHPCCLFPLVYENGGVSFLLI